MTDHPITPPPELVRQWCDPRVTKSMHFSEEDLATRAAQWGADQELEACCAVLDGLAYEEAISSDQLRTARRPKPSLKEQALQVLEDLNLDSAHYNILLSALEGLDTLTYACDRIRRMAGPVGPEGVVLSRSDASRIRTCIASALGMNDHELACKLADAQLASEEDPEVAKQQAQRLLTALDGLRQADGRISLEN